MIFEDRVLIFRSPESPVLLMNVISVVGRKYRKSLVFK